MTGRRARAAQVLRRCACACALVLALACERAPEGAVAPEQLARWKEQAEQVRELRFERPLELVRIAPERIPALIRGEIEHTFSPALARAYSAAFAALGLLPQGMDLFGVLVDVYGEQLVGLYEPREERLYVRDAPPSETGYSLDVVALHELVHALQHQHFPGTISAQFGLEHEDDLATMLSVVTEGDASLAAFALSPTHGRSADALAPVRDAMMKEVDAASGAYVRAPRPLRLRLIAPYAEGLWLAARVFERGGNRALDRWVGDPPLSTLSLLDPEAPPRAVDFIGLPLEWLQRELAPRGCRIGHHDVVGPLMIAALFEERGAPASAVLAGSWSGDRLLHAVCGGTSELLWLTRWESAESAARFADAYRAIAPAVAEAGALAAPPEVFLSERTVAIRTRAFAEVAAGLEARIKVRSYESFARWTSDGCFPEARCPALH